ncbi:hypothetical protein [Demetria terragena]|uniref:hypothetical protein n=1 Tax=Demetria terragena TaxID=63959 RepID=UPI00037EFBF4|nr:hypothetical protein [Demetria terragena]
MVAVLARLQLTLMARGLRQSPGRVIGLLLGAFFGLVAVTAIVVTFAVSASNSAAQIQSLTVAILTSVVIAWIVLPLLLFGVDATLDPARFALLPLTINQLRPALLAAGLCGVPGVLTALVLLGSLLAWTGQSALTIVVALLMAPVLLLTCFLAARALTSWFAAALSSRRFQDFSALVLGIFVVSFGLGSQLLTNGLAADPDRTAGLMEDSAAVLGWTPLGWAAAVPGDVAQQQWGVAAARLVLALALVVLLWVVWGRALHRALTTAIEAGSAPAAGAGGFADRIYPATPAGAIAARCLRYWRRDPRYSVSLVSLVVVPLMIGVTSTFGPGGAGLGAFAMPVILATLVGVGLVADLAYDHSALWTHVALGAPAVADRMGRILAVLTITAPILVLSYAAALAMSGRADLWLPLLAALPPLLFGGLGVCSWVGAINPGQAPPPGTNPFGTGGSGAGVLTMLIFFGAGLATVVLAAPILIPLMIWGSDTLVAAILLAVGLAWGLLILRLGVTAGGRRLEQTWPEILTKVSVGKA